MFFIDIPNVPPQQAPMVIAQNSQSTRKNLGRSAGVCQPIENKPESKTSAINSVAPIGDAYTYLENIEHQKIDESIFENAKLTILQNPEHGVLAQDDKSLSFMYMSSDYHYEGTDKATVFVEMGGYKINVIYYFKLMQNVPGSSDQGTATDNKKICPNGYMWKISSANSPLMLAAQNGLTLHSRGTR